MCLNEGMRKENESSVGEINGICGKKSKMDMLNMGWKERGCIKWRKGRGDDREKYEGKGGDKKVMEIKLWL